jgi:DNA polymerase-3 subunit beta
MKLKAQRETFLKPVQAVIGVVERRQTMPILANVLITAGKDGLAVTASDLEVELVAKAQVEVEGAGEITVPGRKLLDLLRALPDGASVAMATERDRLVIRSGKSRFTLSTLPAREFPVIDDIQTQRQFTVPQKSLRELIDRTAFAMAHQDVRYYLNGLLFEMAGPRLRTVATDGHRLALCDADGSADYGQQHQVIVPRKGVLELQRLLEDADTPATVEVGSNHIRVDLPSLKFTSKLIDGRFPDYERVVPKQGDKELIADRSLLRDALSRASILSNEKYRGIRLTLSGSTLKIVAHNPEQEEAEEELEVKYSGGDLEIGFNVTYLLDALNAVQGDSIRVGLADANSSCLIAAPDRPQARYVVMPMRL